MGFFKKKTVIKTYDKENKKPVIKASICNGEQVAGFKDIHTGKIEEVMLIKSPTDLEHFKAMLVLMDSEAKLDRYVSDVPDIAWDLISVSDKPLTIIYSSAKNLATNLLGADGSVGIRITNEEFSKKLCERFRKPLVSTSANVSGEPSPANFSEVSEVIKEGVDYIVSYRQDDMSKAAPSGIIKLGAGGLVQVIR